jgi:Sulfotransferase family
VYPQKEPRTLVRLVGQAPLQATVYELDRLRGNLCGEVFTAQEPEGVGPGKYDETTAAMIALLKYGSGMPFYRLEKLEHSFSTICPSATRFHRNRMVWMQERFFILGCQRTGTTLMRLVLESHPDVFCYDELKSYAVLRQRSVEWVPGSVLPNVKPFPYNSVCWS